MSCICSSTTSVYEAQQHATAMKIEMAVQATALRALKSQGEAMASLVEVAAQLGKELGKGQHFDAMG